MWFSEKQQVQERLQNFLSYRYPRKTAITAGRIRALLLFSHYLYAFLVNIHEYVQEEKLEIASPIFHEKCVLLFQITA